MNFSWKDEMLLREAVALAHVPDRSQTGPRAPLPETDDSVAGQLAWWQGLANSRHHEITALVDRLYRAEWEARRYRKLFVGAASIAGVLGVTLAILVANLWLS